LSAVLGIKLRDDFEFKISILDQYYNLVQNNTNSSKTEDKLPKSNKIGTSNTDISDDPADQAADLVKQLN
jgi:hypothetical protein